ncbi:ankyrin repeat family protein [Striga asiatica]|uniref:Ankyrin repeat family protein n=1 Tax=Striga asiatica TaxID=4170 RepID=A0A5A7PRD1_STRAF|nr:ankyrin repeat family protein [Striga asiatica]
MSSLNGVAFLLRFDFPAELTAIYTVADGIAGGDGAEVASELHDFLRTLPTWHDFANQASATDRPLMSDAARTPPFVQQAKYRSSRIYLHRTTAELEQLAFSDCTMFAGTTRRNVIIFAGCTCVAMEDGS